jgi:hypothetical protein
MTTTQNPRLRAIAIGHAAELIDALLAEGMRNGGWDWRLVAELHIVHAFEEALRTGVVVVVEPKHEWRCPACGEVGPDRHVCACGRSVASDLERVKPPKP